MYYSTYPKKKKGLLQKKSGVFDFFYEIYVKCAGTQRVFSWQNCTVSESKPHDGFRQFGSHAKV